MTEELNPRTPSLEDLESSLSELLDVSAGPPDLESLEVRSKQPFRRIRFEIGLDLLLLALVALVCSLRSWDEFALLSAGLTVPLLLNITRFFELRFAVSGTRKEKDYLGVLRSKAWFDLMFQTMWAFLLSVLALVLFLDAWRRADWEPVALGSFFAIRAAIHSWRAITTPRPSTYREPARTYRTGEDR